MSEYSKGYREGFEDGFRFGEQAARDDEAAKSQHPGQREAWWLLPLHSFFIEKYSEEYGKPASYSDLMAFVRYYAGKGTTKCAFYDRVLKEWDELKDTPKADTE